MIKRKYLKIKSSQLKQWILYIVIRFEMFVIYIKCKKKIKNKELWHAIKTTYTVGRACGVTIKGMVTLLDCEKDIKNPLTVWYITRYSALNVDRILELNEFVDMEDPFVIGISMSMANKGYSDKLIIDRVCKANEATRVRIT